MCSPVLGGYADVKRYETLIRDDDDTGKYLADRYQAFKDFYEKNRGFDILSLAGIIN